MENLFTLKANQSYLEIIIFILMFSGIAIIRNTNTNYISFLIKNFTLKKDSFYKSLSSVNLNNKSTFFLNVNFLLAASLLLHKIYHGSFLIILFSLLVFKIIQSLSILTLEKIFLNKNDLVSYIKRRIAFSELLGIIALIFLFITHFLNLPENLLIALSSIAMIAIWIKLVIVLSHNLSVSHIILYLCTLEILPILFLAKFIYKHLA